MTFLEAFRSLEPEKAYGIKPTPKVHLDFEMNVTTPYKHSNRYGFVELIEIKVIEVERYQTVTVRMPHVFKWLFWHNYNEEEKFPAWSKIKF